MLKQNGFHRKKTLTAGFANSKLGAFKFKSTFYVFRSIARAAHCLFRMDGGTPGTRCMGEQRETKVIAMDRGASPFYFGAPGVGSKKSGNRIFLNQAGAR